LAISRLTKLPVDVWVEILDKPSVKAKELIVVPVSLEKDWRTQVNNYLLNREIPSDRSAVTRLTNRSARYCVLNNILY